MVKRPVAWASVVACVCAGMICAAMLAPARAFAIEPYPMSIAGTVTMTDGTPVPGVAVSIRSSYGDLQTATTDAAGEYRSGYLSDGVYSVEAEAEGLSSDGPYYVDVSWEGVRVDFVMARPQIAGRVTADGNAVAEAIIMLFRKAGSGITVEALDFTGPDGHYGFAGVPDGDYVVGFERSEIAGVIYSDAFWRDATTVEAATSLPVDAASAHTGIDISLSRAHPSVTGTYSESGAGLADVLIRVYQRSTRGAWAPIDQERTGPDGTFTIHDLPTGAYRVGATSWIEGASAHPGGFYGGGASVATARDIYVTEGAPPVRITIAGAAIENVAPDAFEDDDDSSRAVPLVAGSSVAHTLAPIGDEDWVSFTAIAGHRYTVTTAVDPPPRVERVERHGSRPVCGGRADGSCPQR